jgi:uncharacterized protein YabN with tetrapyrrole methylase and pyrophosphatase domain
MKNEFEEFVDLMEKNIDRCPWTKELSTKDFQEEISKEAKELERAIKNDDNENIKEELGDLFWDVMTTAYLAEKEGRFKAKDILKSVKEKMKKRKPFLLGKKKNISLKECMDTWNKAKQQEKK